MKKIGKGTILCFCICMLFSLAVFAQGNGKKTQSSDSTLDSNQETIQNMIQNTEGLSRLVDEAGLLDEQEADALLEKLNEVSETWKCDVVLASVASLNGRDITSFADDFFDYNGYGQGKEKSGILFLVAMEEREWAISTRGFAITAFTDKGQAYIIKQLKSSLSDGEYYDAFLIFAKEADTFLKAASEGKPYDGTHMPVHSSDILLCVVIGLIGGFLLALLRVSVMKWKMRTVYQQAEASHYLEKNSCKMRVEKDHLVRKSVNRIRIERKDDSGNGGSSVHTSSSGASHGGSHGSF